MALKKIDLSASEVHELNAGDTYQSRAGISK